ncbi:MAG: hypothetical protein CL535_06160 [Ahrensia sp.]|nr:hypothetical protein [Ahrensia sp.]|tara:strand:+ start:4300 stop:5322 length:1023 start_codon:yes stop_codon:yes gene_type:complete
MLETALNSQPGETPPLSGAISSSVFPEHNRLNSWREHFGEQFLRLQIDPLDDEPFRYDASFTMMQGLHVSRGSVSAIRCTRTRDLIDDSNDDMVILIPQRGMMRVMEGGKEMTIGSGDALVRRSSEVGQTLSTGGEYLTMSVPHSALAGQVLDIDRLGFAIVPEGNTALGLLASYLNAILASNIRENGQGPDLAASILAARHVHELTGLVLDSSRDNWYRLDTVGSGIQEARMAAIRSEIERHAGDPDFSINDVARRQGVSPGYIRKLLAARGERFTDTLRAARLDLACRMLRDHRHQQSRILEIAYHCGFSDISYFNRSFRQRFGMTPGDARRQDPAND